MRAAPLTVFRELAAERVASQHGPRLAPRPRANFQGGRGFALTAGAMEGNCGTGLYNVSNTCYLNSVLQARACTRRVERRDNRLGRVRPRPRRRFSPSPGSRSDGSARRGSPATRLRRPRWCQSVRARARDSRLSGRAPLVPSPPRRPRAPRAWRPRARRVLPPLIRDREARLADAPRALARRFPHPSRARTPSPPHLCVFSLLPSADLAPPDGLLRVARPQCAPPR